MKITNFLHILTIRERLAVGYGLLILILLVGGGYTLYSLYKIDGAQQQIAASVASAAESVTAMGHAQESERLALEWAYPVLGERSALSAYILAEDDDQKKKLFAEFAAYGDRIGKISELIEASLVSEDAKKQVADIRVLQDSIRNAAIGVIAAFDGEVEYGPETRKNMERFSALVEELKAKVKEFQDRNNKEVEGFKSTTATAVKNVSGYVGSANDQIASSINSNMLVTLIGVIFAVTVAMLMYRSIIQPLARASRVAARIASYDLRPDAEEQAGPAGRDELSKLLTDLSSMRSSLANLMAQVMNLVTGVSQACSELTSAAQGVEGASQRQLEYVKDSSTSTAQMSDMAGELAKTATEAAACAEQADGVARASVEKDAKQTLEIIGVVEQEVEGAHLQIRSLWEAAEQVSSILTVINEIADQTNLLALNAAIEAARAGEQGRGFAVVADEVRALAKRTTESTSKIESTISHIQQETSKALENMGHIKGRVVSGAESVSGIIELLKQIQQLVARLQDINRGVATATEEQSTETTNISNNLYELEKESEQLDREASTISERASGLLATVNKLKSEVSRFVI